MGATHLNLMLSSGLFKSFLLCEINTDLDKSEIVNWACSVGGLFWVMSITDFYFGDEII